VLAGGGPENALVIIDPQLPESIYVGNYYINAHAIPPQNVIYMASDSSSYPSFVNFQNQALVGSLANRLISNHIDYVVVAPGPNYFVTARNLVNDGCSSVTEFSASTVYTFSFIADNLLEGGSPVTRRNQYFGGMTRAFDSGTKWKTGSPSKANGAERYLIGAMLGYTGERGNTVDEILRLIDDSVSIEGTRPEGTFYFMKTTDRTRSGPRDPFFPAAIAAIRNLGGQAEQIDAVLPQGRHDCLGIMTGWATPDIDNADITILPGAMCDHLTSFAARFNTSSQTKLSRWIANGATGSFGTVQEPCNYPGKFPVPRFHVHYFKGLTLGEAGLRSLKFLPWQVLAYGDPLSQPFAYIPQVSVIDFPDGPVSGKITISAEAATERPNAKIAKFELFIDGVSTQRASRDSVFKLDTTVLPDGNHDVRVIAYDNSDIKNQGRWMGTLVTDNRGQSAHVTVSPDVGDRSTLFDVTVAGDGGGSNVVEILLLQNGRVIASAQSGTANFMVRGETLGAGQVSLEAVARFEDGNSARSEPFALDIDFSNPPERGSNTSPPVAYSYAREIPLNKPAVVELAGFDVDDPHLSYEVTGLPDQATVEGDGPYRLIKPNPRASGTDTMTFVVTSDGQTSEPGVITLDYGSSVPCNDIKKFKARCRRSKLKVNIKINNAIIHEGDVITVSVDGTPNDLPISNGKVKLILPDQEPGEHTVALDFPSGCKSPIVVTCG